MNAFEEDELSSFGVMIEELPPHPPAPVSPTMQAVEAAAAAAAMGTNKAAVATANVARSATAAAGAAAAAAANHTKVAATQVTQAVARQVTPMGNSQKMSSAALARAADESRMSVAARARMAADQPRRPPAGVGGRSGPATTSGTPGGGGGARRIDAGVSRQSFSNARVKQILANFADDEDDGSEMMEDALGGLFGFASQSWDAPHQSETDQHPVEPQSISRPASPPVPFYANHQSAYYSHQRQQQYLRQHAEEEFTAGILQGARKWWSGMRERRQREDLERQVEEQRRRLQEEAGRMSSQRASSTEDSSSSLKNNSTFQQLSGANRRRICGVEMDFSNGDDHQQYYEGQSAATQSSRTESHNGGATNGHRRDSYLRISSPQLTYSGDGMTVQLELNDDGEGDDGKANGNGAAKPGSDTVPPVAVEPEPPTKYPFCPYILSAHQMRAIASKALPPSVAYSRWKRLYCLARDGDSFESCLHRVEKDNRTLMVIRTTDGDIFGGYAESKWESTHYSMVGAQYYGSAQAFLFSIRSTTEEDSSSTTEEADEDEDEFDYLDVYKWTGANRYVQLCDGHHQMMAFGGGGNEGEFGLCVEDDFRRGSTGHCLTFENEPLCSGGQFEIVDIEIWGFVLGFY